MVLSIRVVRIGPRAKTFEGLSQDRKPSDYTGGKILLPHPSMKRELLTPQAYQRLAECGRNVSLTLMQVKLEGRWLTFNTATCFHWEGWTVYGPNYLSIFYAITDRYLSSSLREEMIKFYQEPILDQDQGQKISIIQYPRPPKPEASASFRALRDLAFKEPEMLGGSVRHWLLHKGADKAKGALLVQDQELLQYLGCLIAAWHLNFTSVPVYSDPLWRGQTEAAIQRMITAWQKEI